MEEISSPYRLVLTTIGNEQDAHDLAQQLVNQGLAACVNVLPRMRSYYKWKGKPEQGDEHQLVIKARAEQVETLIDTIAANHPYELPEILVVPIAGGLTAYLNWITESVYPHDEN